MRTRNKSIMVVLALLVSLTTFAAIRPFYQDIKLPTQAVMEKQTISDPLASATTNILAASAGATSAAVATVTTFLAQPDVPRNLVITPGPVNQDVGTCTITATGTNIFNQTITEDFAFAGNATSATTGNKAFKTLTSLSFAANCEDGGFGATWNVGTGEKLGAKRCMDSAGHLVFSTVAGAYETTRPTVAANATAVESNTFDFNGTMNGVNDFEAFFVQNFRCHP